jgi:DNA-directed RNA polymerase specialized sigma24 family protein
LDPEKLNCALEKLKEHSSDADAWEKLYRLLWPFLLTQMYRNVGGNRYLAEEASQEVMLRLLRYYDFETRHTNSAGFLNYLKNTCTSVLSDLARFSKRHPRASAASDETEQPESLPDRQPSPEQKAILHTALEQLAGRLDSMERTILALLMEGKNLDRDRRNRWY